MTSIFQSALTIKDLTSVFAKADMKIYVQADQVNIPPSTLRYAY